MASRNPRPGGLSRPAMTKTHALRAAQSAAQVNKGACPGGPAGSSRQQPTSARNRNVRGTIPRPGPPPTDPKKVDFRRPGMTKAMEARMRKAQEFQKDYARREEEQLNLRTGHRATARPQQPGTQRDRSTSRPTRDAAAGPCPSRTPSRPPSRAPSRSTTSRPISGKACPVQTPCVPGQPGPSSTRAAKSPGGLSSRTVELSKMLDADIVQADPVGPGTPEDVVIPPGVINPAKATIINIRHSEGHLPSSTMDLNNPPGLSSGGMTSCSAINKSVQAINESLDEQDAAESSVVQCKLQELQIARREFVMTVANVANNAVSIATPEETANVTPIEPPLSPFTYRPPSPRLYRIPDVHTYPGFQVPYGRDHPDVVAAREFLARRRAEREEEDAFRAACDNNDDTFLQDEFLEGPPEISLDEVEDPCRAPYTRIPRVQNPYNYGEFNPGLLQAFMNTRDFPVRPAPPGPPPGRENLNRDLWDFDDPWYHTPVCDAPDLMQFSPDRPQRSGNNRSDN